MTNNPNVSIPKNVTIYNTTERLDIPLREVKSLLGPVDLFMGVTK